MKSPLKVQETLPPFKCCYATSQLALCKKANRRKPHMGCKVSQSVAETKVTDWCFLTMGGSRKTTHIPIYTGWREKYKQSVAHICYKTITVFFCRNDFGILSLRSIGVLQPQQFQHSRDQPAERCTLKLSITQPCSSKTRFAPITYLCGPPPFLITQGFLRLAFYYGFYVLIFYSTE